MPKSQLFVLPPITTSNTTEILSPQELLRQMPLPWHAGLFGLEYSGFTYLARKELLKDCANTAPYSRNIVVRKEEQIVGVLQYTWQESHPLAPFPHYELSFVDVHEKHRLEGIGKKLFEGLNTSNDIQGEVIRRTEPQSYKTKDFSDKVGLSLRADTYALLPAGFKLPKKPISPRGIVGKRMQNSDIAEDKVIHFQDYR